MIQTLLQSLPNPPDSPQVVQWVWWVIIILLGLGIALIILLSKKREDVQVTNEKRATAAESLVKVRDTELLDCNKGKERLLAENTDLESENKVLVGIKISELMKFWENKAQIEEEIETLKSQLRVTKATLKKWEDGGMK